jgi:hypothetical protein
MLGRCNLGWKKEETKNEGRKVGINLEEDKI